MSRLCISGSRKHLKKEQLPKRQCQLYVVGADRWITMEDLPEKGQTENLYLDAGSFTDGAATLTQKPGKEAKVTYTYDPENPVMSHGTEYLL